MDYQKFRFCCGCQQIALIKNKECYFCMSAFIVEGIKSEEHEKNIKNYYRKNKLKQLTKNTEI